MLTVADLFADPILIRKILRIQKSRRAVPSDDEDDVPSNRRQNVATVLSSEFGEDIDAIDPAAPADEVRSQTPIWSEGAPRGTQGTVILDLAGSDDSDEGG